MSKLHFFNEDQYEFKTKWFSFSGESGISKYSGWYVYMEDRELDENPWIRMRPYAKTPSDWDRVSLEQVPKSIRLKVLLLVS